MALSVGVRLGPYEVAELLGAGGMGAVYRARDPRLGRDVAIKVLPDDIGADPDRLRRFEQEARAIAALNHPNILSVYDVGTQPAGESADASASAAVPYVVTELLEGETLREVLKRRTPTQRQILGWAVQTAQGLAAAHRKGIVHRDLKPENLFLTTEGRVKILDFGLAKLISVGVDSEDLTASHPTRPGVLMGTVAYMSPEQVQALPVDARSDLFSFGVVQYEMLVRKHPFRRETVAATLSAILQETPPELGSMDPSIPRAVDGVVRRCLEKRREDRFSAGHDLSLALEAVLAAPTGAGFLQEVEERSPYPGLSSFTENDAAFFFGREGAVKTLWERIRSRRLLAVIGPSGVGKTSFLRAGLLPARSEGWVALVCTPGTAPFRGLGQALGPALAGDAEALSQLAGFEEPETALALLSRWRRSHAEALVVVDQFEELFTLNAADTQQRFAALLGRLVSEADVHVVLSLRDDFLIRCSDHPPLASVFSEITPLTALTRAGLERSLVEPAKKQGYRFDDDSLVSEMVSLVEGVRGALPLLAFAVARLWEKRDREKKLLTRQAYQEIAGVEGALAQHAEATMDRIGTERQGLVREVFRNLVTAQGTRAVVDREELLSAFPDRAAAEDVLRLLIDARLLTTYEVEGKQGEPSHHRVEVVHESLLKAWPRLVRWQAQDEEGAVLRDQLKQAAHLWNEKGRTSDLLWTGTAHQEFELWRGRYPGALTALEEDFAHSMAERAQRTRRLRRAVVAAVIIALTAVATAIGISRQKAVEAARRSEGSRVLALAELRLAEDPTEALALATASLELADNQEARVFALKALWEGPPAFELIGGTNVRIPAFSPDGRQLAVAGHSPEARVWREDGSGPLVLPGHTASPLDSLRPLWSSPSRLVVGSIPGGRASVWSLPDGRLERTIEFGTEGVDVIPGAGLTVLNSKLFVAAPLGGAKSRPADLRLRSWPLPDGPPVDLGRVPQSLGTFGRGGESWIYAKGSTLRSRALPASHQSADSILGEHPAEIVGLGRTPGKEEVVTANREREMRVWTFEFQEAPRVETLSIPGAMPEASGRWLVKGGLETRIQLWTRAAWPAARPLDLRRNATWYLANLATHPSGDWLVATTGNLSRLTFWPLRRPRPVVVDGYRMPTRPVTFSPDGRWLASNWPPGESLRVWPLAPGSTAPRPTAVPSEDPYPYNLAFDPGGRFLFRVGNGGEAWVVPLDGRPARRLEGFSKPTVLQGAAVSPSGRYVATAFFYGTGEKNLRVWDLETGATRAFDLPQPAPPPNAPASQRTDFEGAVLNLAFAGESTLYSGGHGGLRRWDLATGRYETIVKVPNDYWVDMRIMPDKGVAVTRQFSNMLVESCAPVVAHDLARHTSRALPAFGSCVLGLELDAAGQVLVTGDKDGIVRVGRLSDAEPHLLVGHKGVIAGLAISPDLEWIASTGEDNTLRLWPMPDLDKPPLQTLPHDELVAKLKSLTNLRAVRDPAVASGWKIELGPFPGWKDIPTW